MQRIIAISLLALVIFQSLSKVWVMLEFKLHQDSIAANLCVNRDKPLLLCSGKCVLVERLSDDNQEKQGQNHSSFKFKALEDLVFLKEKISIAHYTRPIFEFNPSINKVESSPATTPHLLAVFHPPD